MKTNIYITYTHTKKVLVIRNFMYQNIRICQINITNTVMHILNKLNSEYFLKYLAARCILHYEYDHSTEFQTWNILHVLYIVGTLGKIFQKSCKIVSFSPHPINSCSVSVCLEGNVPNSIGLVFEVGEGIWRFVHFFRHRIQCVQDMKF